MPYLELSPDFRPYYEVHDFTDPWTMAETIVFIHGFAENTTAWNAWIPYLSRHFRLVTFDLRGLGRTAPVPEDFTFSTELMVDDIVRVINHVAGEAVHLICAKSAGISTLRLAATRPDLVRSVTLGCPALYAPGSSDWLPHMEAHGMRSWARKTMPPRLGREASQRCIDWWVDMMGATTMSTTKAYLRWVVTTAAHEDLSQVKCPAFVIMTTLSAQTNAAAGQMTPEQVRDLLPHAEIFMVDRDCYHATAAVPDVCAPATLDFLRRLS